MRKAVTALAALAILAAIAGAGIASAVAEEGSVTVKGEILDMGCYMGHEAHGAEHAGCAVKCVKGGQPMGLLAEDGTVYLLYASHQDGSAFEKAKDLAGKMVVITGKGSTRGGIHGIEVGSVNPA